MGNFDDSLHYNFGTFFHVLIRTKRKFDFTVMHYLCLMSKGTRQAKCQQIQRKYTTPENYSKLIKLVPSTTKACIKTD